jgi:hypothetical protein
MRSTTITYTNTRMLPVWFYYKHRQFAQGATFSMYTNARLHHSLFWYPYMLGLPIYKAWTRINLVQGAIIRVLTYRRYANITVWYFFVFSHVPRRYAELLLSAYLFFAGTTTTTWPFQVQGIQYRNLVGISCVWDVLAWNMIALMALRNIGVGCLNSKNTLFK